MMYDRPYMTTSFEDRAKKLLFWIIGINVGVFVLQNILSASGAKSVLNTYFALRADSLGNGFIWTPITYSFLHSTSSFLHILGNMLGVFFLGRAVLPVLGQKRFLQLYLASAIVGGLLWFIVSFASNASSVIGASAAVFGLLAFFACLYPNQEIQILLFFILPIRVRPKVLAFVMLGISVLGLFFQEIFSQGDNIVAHSAHLGGMLAGFLFHRYVYLANPYGSSPSGRAGISIPKIFQKGATKTKDAGYRYNVNVSSEPRDLKAEVDRILDKINSKGFGSLTAAEKKALDDARELLRKR